MLDPVSLGIALTAIAVIVAVIFYITSGGDDFEKAYDANARKLLNQDKDKPKQKTKNVKKKDTKEKKHETSKSESDEKETPAAVAESAPVAVEVAPTPVVTAPAPTVEVLKTKKSNGKKEKVPSDPAPVTPEQPKVSSENEKENAAPIVTETKQDVSSTDGKKKKKNKGKKEETHDVETVQTVGSVTAVPSKTESAPRPNKAKKVPVINVSELDSNKVLTRLASLEEIEPEYISYLATYFHDSNAKANSLSTALDAFKAGEADLKKKMEQNLVARTAAEKQLVENQRRVADLSAKVQQLSAQEETNKTQLSAINNIRQENETLKAALRKSSMDAAEASRSRTQAEQLRQQLEKSSSRVAELEATLSQQQSLVAAAKADNSRDELDALKTEFATLDAVARQMKAELEEKRSLVEEVKQKAAEEGVKRAEHEREEMIRTFNEEKLQWEQKESNLMEEYQSLQALVGELHKEVAKFETYKREQDAKNSELAAREERVAELEKSTKSASEKLAQENSELRNSVAALTKKLDEAAASHAAELSPLCCSPLDTSVDLGQDAIDCSFSCYTPLLPATPRKDVVEVVGEEETSYVWRESFPPGSSRVELACSQWDWKPRPMTRLDGGNVWQLSAVLDTHSAALFKFVVDGVWQCSDNYGLFTDSEGVVNNFLPLEPSL